MIRKLAWIIGIVIALVIGASMIHGEPIISGIWFIILCLLELILVLMVPGKEPSTSEKEDDEAEDEDHEPTQDYSSYPAEDPEEAHEKPVEPNPVPAVIAAAPVAVQPQPVVVKVILRDRPAKQTRAFRKPRRNYATVPPASLPAVVEEAQEIEKPVEEHQVPAPIAASEDAAQPQPAEDDSKKRSSLPINPNLWMLREGAKKHIGTYPSVYIPFTYYFEAIPQRGLPERFVNCLALFSNEETLPIDKQFPFVFLDKGPDIMPGPKDIRWGWHNARSRVASILIAAAAVERQKQA